MKPPEIPGLQFTALLAKGEMFTTWKATKESLQREVDVRVLNEGVPPEQAEHQLAMARTLARLTHPGLAQIHDVITEGDATHVIMEHVEGASLAEMVAGTGRLNSAQALRLALQLAEALDYAWTQAQVVFRSLKPQNLRVNRQGTLKISEYSLAIQVKPGENPLEADQGHVIGTPHFIAPEQAALSPAIDFRADMYSLGTVLYFMLTGTSPFEGRDNYEILEQQVGGQIPHPRDIVGNLPMPVCQFVTRLMMKLPQDRYAQWSDAIRDLRQLLANRPLVGRLPDGVSTIASFAGRAAVRGASIKRGSLTTTAGTAMRAPRRGGGARVLLWLLLMVWFAWLANERLGNPLSLPPALVVDIGLPDLNLSWLRKAAPEDGQPPATQPLASMETGTAAMPSGEETAGALPADTAASAADTAVGTAAEPDPGSTAPVVAAAAAPGLAEAASLLAAGDKAGALVKLEELLAASPDATGIAAIRDALKTLPSPQPAVEAGLMAQRGQQIVIRYQGRERKIMPRAIVDGKLQAEFIAGEGISRPVVFQIDKLVAAEQLRWLPEPQTPVDHAIVCLLALQAGDKERLRAHSARAGALAPLFAAVNP